MISQLPSNLHLVHGVKKTENVKPSQKKIRTRIPKADWLDNPDAWDKSVFIEETSNFLWETYNIGADQDKHLLAALATQIEIYVKCMKGIAEDGIITQFNAGQTIGTNPLLSASDKALSKIVLLMNELGLTPKGRLSNTRQEAGKYQNLLDGP